MAESEYEREWQRQLKRDGITDAHLPVYRWYLKMDDPGAVRPVDPPRDGLTFMRAVEPRISFYRYLYHTAGEEYLWGDRRRMSDDDLAEQIQHSEIHVVVMYSQGVPAGFFELSFASETSTNLKYFALLPGFTGGGLGSYMLNHCIVYAAQHRSVPLTVDTCTLDHPVALENYKSRGFEFVRGEDEIYPDPRLDGTVPRGAGPHVPIPV